MGMQYFKTTKWKLQPTIKGPVPEGLNYELPAGTQTANNEIYSIDGERYPAQDITGVVLPKCLPLHY